MIAKTQTRRYRWYAGLTLLAVFFSLLGVRSSGLANPSQTSLPVWGRKPVLGYFFLTASLSDLLRTEVGLSETQFQAAQEIARQEVGQIQALERSSQVVLADPELSLEDKRLWVQETGYNQQVLGILEASQQDLETAFSAATYQELVDWIEARWLVEKAIHGPTQQQAGARTFSIYATRYDSNGAYTVALPDKCVKFANIGWDEGCASYGYEVGGDYRVRVAYNGSSATVKVLEAGPWNLDDTYWATVNDPTPRRMFTDLPLGIPEAQAAYFDGYNGGLSQFGTLITAPYGIDLARELSIDIGLMPGDNDWVDVTFLWTENWDVNPSVQVVLDQPTSFQPAVGGDFCANNWYPIDGYGGDPAYLTLNVQTQAYSTNWAEWAPDLPAAGDYRVEAYIPDHERVYWTCLSKWIDGDTSDARYSITYANGVTNVSRDQLPMTDEWLNLGTFEFEEGRSGKVKLTDLNGEADFSRTVSFSAMRFSLLAAPTPTPMPTRTPTPTATPTPTPTPAPFIWTGSGITEPSAPITIPVGASHVQLPGLGSAIVDVSYDPALVDVVACLPDPTGQFDDQSCDPDYERDGNYPDVVRFDLSSAGGVEGSFRLADLILQVLGVGGETSRLDVTPQAFIDPQGTPVPAPAYGGSVCVAPCRSMAYFPLFMRDHDSSAP